MFTGLNPEINRLCRHEGGGEQKGEDFQSERDYLNRRAHCNEIKPLHTGSAGPVFQCDQSHVYKFIPRGKECVQHAFEYYVPQYMDHLYGKNANIVKSNSIQGSYIRGKPVDVLETKLMPQGDYIEWASRLDQSLPGALFIENYTRMLQAVANLHHNGVIHGDIKPDNIFMENNLMSLGDFGLSCIDPVFYDRDRENLANVESLQCNRDTGTLKFLPPYVIVYQRNTWQSDMYALTMSMSAVLDGERGNEAMVETLKGRLPYENDRVWEQYGNHNRHLLLRALAYLDDQELLPIALRNTFVYLVAESILGTNPYYAELTPSPQEMLDNVSKLNSGKQIQVEDEKRKELINRIASFLLYSKRIPQTNELQFGRQRKRAFVEEKEQVNNKRLKKKPESPFRRTASLPVFDQGNRKNQFYRSVG